MMLAAPILISTLAWSMDLQTVLENTAFSPPTRVDFTEERHSILLKEPILLTGYLEYIKAGQLRKVVETPFSESFLITERYIEIEQGGRTRRLSMSKAKPIRAIFESIEAILSGQSDKLSAMFRYELSGSEDSWSLKLLPLSRRVSAHLTSMLVTGNEQRTTSIRIDMKNGEWSLMSIQSPALQHE